MCLIRLHGSRKQEAGHEWIEFITVALLLWPLMMAIFELELSSIS
jgi:hypothetical protein